MAKSSRKDCACDYTDGDYSWNTTRKSPEEEASYTFYVYEELKALIRAVERAGLGVPALERILYSNSANLIRQALVEPLFPDEELGAAAGNTDPQRAVATGDGGRQ